MREKELRKSEMREKEWRERKWKEWMREKKKWTGKREMILPTNFWQPTIKSSCLLKPQLYIILNMKLAERILCLWWLFP